MTLFRRIRRRALTFVRDMLALLIKQALTRCPALVNVVYNKLSHDWLGIILHNGFLLRPYSSFEWDVDLVNGKTLKVPVVPDDRFSFSCAIDYKWHDIGLRRTQEFFLDHMTDKSLYIDIGANIGVSSIYAMSAGRRAWLFEPNTELHEFGKSLFAHNGYNTARWESVALSDAPGEATFFVSRSSFLSSFDRDHAQKEGSAKEITVPVKTLDSYLSELQNFADDLLLKIDVEGHEMSVLKGASRVLAAYRPPVLLELLANSQGRQEAWDFFKVLGYQCFAIQEVATLSLQPLQSVEELNAMPLINFLFIPAEHRLNAELANYPWQKR